MSELKTIKITHKEAEIKVRGRFTLNSGEKTALYLLLREYFDIQEALILSTCNRTEIYYVHPQDLSKKIKGLLASFKGVRADLFQQYFSSVNDGNEALRHLFRVGIGLDAQVLGDIQIFGQVKKAYQEAIDVGMCQTILHRALHTLFYTHKQVCQETDFKSGAASVSYNAVKVLQEEKLANFDSRILVAGAGKMGTDVCRNLVCMGFKNVTITNRSHEKSFALQRELNIKVLDYAEMFDQLELYPVLISTVSAEQPVFDLNRSSLNSNNKSFTCIDLSAPASFSEDFIQNLARHYFNIDHIGTFTKKIISRRAREVPKVEAIIRQALLDFNKWEMEYEYTKQIKVFKETLDHIRKESIVQYQKKADETQLELIEEVSKSLIQRIIKHSAVQLKQACQRGQADQLSHTINQIFNLEFNQIST